MNNFDFRKLGKEAIFKAQKLGAEHSEAFLMVSKDLDINVSKQTVDNIKFSEEMGIGIRIYKDARIGFSYTSDLNISAVDKTLQQALANAEKTAPDEYLTLGTSDDEYENLSLYDPTIAKETVDNKINLAKEIENQALNSDKRIKIVERAGYEDSQYEIFLYNSLGLEAFYEGAYCGGYALAVGQQNDDKQTGFGMQYTLNFEELSPEKIGHDATKRAVRLLGAVTVNSQIAPLVLEPYIAANFLGVVSHALSAEAVDKGKSFLGGKEKQKVADESVTLIDDGAMSGRVLSAPFDGEGVPTSQTLLIENGILQSYLHNLYTAKKFGVKSTGNGVRGSYKSTPEVGTTNFYLASGKYSPEQIIKEIDKGLYVTDVMGLHTVNPISGDFSLGASGIWIENGELAYPVRGIAIAGNLKDILLKIDKVGNDLTFFVGKGSPTLKIKDISISGS